MLANLPSKFVLLDTRNQTVIQVKKIGVLRFRGSKVQGSGFKGSRFRGSKVQRFKVQRFKV